MARLTFRQYADAETACSKLKYVIFGRLDVESFSLTRPLRAFAVELLPTDDRSRLS